MKPKKAVKKKASTKKAVTLLTRIERSLSDVLDGLSVVEKSVEKNVRSVLLSAQASIGTAIDFISALPAEVLPRAAPPRKRGAKKRSSAPAAKRRPSKT